MTHAVFVAPYFLPTTLRFIAAVARLEDVRLGLVSVDPEDQLPAEIRTRLAGHYRIDDGLDPDQIERAARAIAAHLGGRLDRIIGTLEELQVPLAMVRERLGIDGLGVDAAHAFRDKDRMKQVLAEAGLPCARHRLIRTPGEVRAFIDAVGFPVVSKPREGAGARSTFRIDGDEQLAQYLATVPPSAERPALLEEFITGEEHSFDSVLIDGELVWHSINHYHPGPLEVLRVDWVQWCVVLPREVDQPRYAPIREAAARALPTLGLRTGLSHMEWFLRGDGSVAISEVGARPPGAQFMTLMSFAHDTDMYAAWARLAATGQFTPPERPYAAGAAYLRGHGGGTIRAVHGLDEAQRELGDLVVEARLPRPGEKPARTYEGDGYVILRHPDTAVVEKGLARLLQLVRVELA